MIPWLSIISEFQKAIGHWTAQCFGQEVADNKVERNHRFIEEALELVQSAGCSKEDVLMLVDYVYNRPAGEITQEIGGVIVTLSALCESHRISLEESANEEYARIIDKMPEIREKQSNKPNGPLPQSNTAKDEKINKIKQMLKIVEIELIQSVEKGEGIQFNISYPNKLDPYSFFNAEIIILKDEGNES